MKILVNDYAGHPFQIDLSRNLAQIGHTVLHTYCSSVQTPRGRIESREDDSANFYIKPISLRKKITKGAFFERRKLEIEYGANLNKEIENFTPDILIISNTPIDSQILIWKTCKEKGIVIIYWLQDIQSIAIKKIIGSKIPVLGNLIAQYYKNQEKRQLKESNHIISISEGFIPTLLNWGIERNKISYIPNWAPIDEISVLNKNNDWAIKHQLADKKVVLYSGTLGFKHNPDLIKKLAVQLREDVSSMVVVISEGIGQDFLQKQKELLNLDNLLLLPFQNFNLMSQVLASADVLIGVLEKDAGIFSVPSKILTYMCSNRPIVLSAPISNLSSEIIETSKAGLVIDPDSDDQFVSEVVSLLNDQNRRDKFGDNGRWFAESNFKPINFIAKFERIIKLPL